MNAAVNVPCQYDGLSVYALLARIYTAIKPVAAVFYTPHHIHHLFIKGFSQVKTKKHSPSIYTPKSVIVSRPINNISKNNFIFL